MNSKIREFKAARLAYNVGYQLLTDYEYEVLKDEVEKEHPDLPELDSLYENDFIDFSLIEEFGIPQELVTNFIHLKGLTNEFSSQETATLNSNNVSIISYKTEEEVLGAFYRLGEGTYVLSPKVDGIYISVLYKRVQGDTFKFACAQSRGSSDNAVDISGNVKYLINNMLTIPSADEDSVLFSFECSMLEKHLLRAGYVTPKSGAMGVIMSTKNRKVELYDTLHLVCHGCSLAKTNLENYTIPKKIGLDTVPYFTVNYDGNTVTLLETLGHITEECKSYVEGACLRIDGVVTKKVEDNITEEALSGYKIYNKDTFAIKVGFWNKGVYTSTISSITSEQRNSDIAYVINIVPVQVSEANSTTLTKLTNIRLSTLLEQSIKVGDTVQFEYNNETTPKFIRKVDGTLENSNKSDY